MEKVIKVSGIQEGDGGGNGEDQFIIMSGGSDLASQKRRTGPGHSAGRTGLSGDVSNNTQAATTFEAVRAYQRQDPTEDAERNQAPTGGG